LATIIDEVLGGLLGFYQRRPSYTASLIVDYVAPVALPGTIVARSWVERGDGNRKWWCKCEVIHWIGKEGGEEAEGMWGVCARGRGLWVEQRETL
jgi:hypothetical protein